MSSKRHAQPAQSMRPGTSDIQDFSAIDSDDLIALVEATSEPFSPEMVLFDDDTEESRHVRCLLIEHGEEFRTIPAKGRHSPAVVFGGIVAERLAGVQGLVDALSGFDRSFEAGIAEQPSRSSPRHD